MYVNMCIHVYVDIYICVQVSKPSKIALNITREAEQQLLGSSEPATDGVATSSALSLSLSLSRSLSERLGIPCLELAVIDNR